MIPACSCPLADNLMSGAGKGCIAAGQGNTKCVENLWMILGF